MKTFPHTHILACTQIIYTVSGPYQSYVHSRERNKMYTQKGKGYG